MRRIYAFAAGIVTLLAVLNGGALWYTQQHDLTFRQDATYPVYIHMRDLLLRPTTIVAIASALVVWATFVYWRSRAREVSKAQKVAVFCVILASFYGVILTALFRL